VDEELVTVCILSVYQIAGMNTYVSVTDRIDLPSKNTSDKTDASNRKI